MTLKALSLVGLGVLGAGAVSVGGYAISAVGGKDQSTENQVATKVQRLLGNDYTFNPPKFTSYEKLIQGCHENLIKVKRSSSVEVDEEGDEEDENFENSKLYGCGVAKMDLWDSGEQFGDEKVHYLTFGSEIFLRKNNEAWRINTLIDNYSSNKLIYRHLLSFLTHQEGGSWETMEAFLIDEKVPESDQKPIESSEQGGTGKLAISAGKKELNIKVPGETGSWFKKSNYFIDGPASQAAPPLTKIHQATKEWSGIWIEDSTKPLQDMFQDIEVFIGDQDKSQVFCKGQSCGGGIGKKYEKDYCFVTQDSVPNAWGAAYSTLINPDNSDDHGSLRHQQGATRPILNFIKNSKGKWSDSNKVCNAKDTEVNDGELKELKVFCSKSNR